jgi:perosamine synthetase
MPMHYSKYEMHRVSEDISRRGLNLPSFPDLIQEELDYIVKSVLEYDL